MKPSHIHSILDVAREIRKRGNTFNPLFVGPPGVGKSFIVQQWCQKNNLPFIDLRAAYLENVDMIGFPQVTTVDGRQVTKHVTPEFWPAGGEGVLLMEEVNRGTTSVMNTFMQLLTDDKIHNYTFPKGWIKVGCINPETEQYDVNSMDAALKNRFQIFEIEYDKNDFISYMKAKGFDRSIVQFVESGLWQYSRPESIGNKAGDKYVSPRTIEQLNSVVQCGFPQEIEFNIYESVLGKNVGRSYYSFKNNERPVLYKDLVDEEKKSLKRLHEFANPNSYKNAQISITVSDIIDTNEITDELLAKVLLAIPTEQGYQLLRDLEFKRNDDKLLKRIVSSNPDVKKKYQETLNAK